MHGLTYTIRDLNGMVKTATSAVLSAYKETTATADARTDGQANFHIGANTNQNIQGSIENMSASAVSIKVIDEAVTKVLAERSKLGAVQNRLDPHH